MDFPNPGTLKVRGTLLSFGVQDPFRLEPNGERRLFSFGGSESTKRSIESLSDPSKELEHGVFLT